MADFTVGPMIGGGGQRGGVDGPIITIGRIGFRRRLQLWIHLTRSWWSQ